MDEKALSREIERHVWPALCELGFDELAERVAWRHLPDRIFVVDIATPPPRATLPDPLALYFEVRIGIDFRIEGHRDASMERPRQLGCHIGTCLTKRIEQPSFPSEETWLVDSDGANVDEVVTDVKRALLDDGTAWFAACHDLDLLLAALRDKDKPVFFEIPGPATREEVIRTLEWIKSRGVPAARVGAI